ncbi:MAG: outer membrane lipoprotein carrier protein LolA, partial [Gemmatimonadaceae bacterium]|nr:outer membrane lipoprotein carrier protein LolA [Acetobacteraceae bacterium]
MPTRRTLLLLLIAHPAAAQAPDLDTLMAGLAAIPSRQATFREERRFGVLDQALVSTGRLTYRRPGYLEKATDWPEAERLVVDGDRLVLTTGNDPPRVVDLGGQPELRTLVDAIRGPLSGDVVALRRAFTITAGGTAADWSLDL